LLCSFLSESLKTPPKKSPVKLHKLTLEEDKAFIEFISVAENHANDYNWIGLPIM
jgi:hypothetical protein